jgi:predicted secreted hydrolase
MNTLVSTVSSLLRRLPNVRLVCLLVFTSAAQGTRADEPPLADWTRALPGWVYRFPADHLVHADYKTEWWYFTGSLSGAGRAQYGYELTFFRQGVLAPGLRSTPPLGGEGRSRFVQRDFKFAHFAITDLAHDRFLYTQRASRGAFGEAGAASDPPSPAQPFVWLDGWTLTAEADGAWRIQASSDDPAPMSIDLRLIPRTPPVIEGTDGVSQKSAGLGNASHYYSFPRLATTGTLAVGRGSQPQPVHGDSWFDHEWASNQLGADQVGWNWFCLQLDDGSDVMLYAMRRRDGTVDPVSSGTFISASGSSEHLSRPDFELQPLRTWQSVKSGARYPLAWHVRIPRHKIDATIRARMDDQELVLPQITYWEGATEVSGTGPTGALGGHGYMELTGYAGGLTALQQPGATGEPSLHPAPR